MALEQSGGGQLDINEHSGPNYTEREWEHLVPRPEPRSYSQQIMRGGRGNDWAIVAGRGGGEEVELLNNIR